MSRLTEVDEYGNADIIGMEDETWQMGLSFNDMNKVTLALNRLHRLEKLYEQHKQPDPDTGLVPCGCGGKAEYTDNATAVCMWCGISTLENFNDADAAKVWNRAMGGDYTIKGIKPPEPDRVDNPPGFDSGRDN